ncbi:UbcD6 [Nucleospora cyclopteri]
MINSTVRLQNEFKNIQKTLTFGCYVKMNSENPLKWDCQIYKEGVYYQLILYFDKKYPTVPPTAVFTSKVFNPNVFKTGHVCLDLLSTRWQPSLTVADIFEGLKQLLQHPNPNSPANEEAAKLYSKNKKQYNKKVEEVNAKNKKYKILGIINK